MPPVAIIDTLRRVLEGEETVSSALLFGSAGRGSMHAGSDVDAAIELRAGASRDMSSPGRLTARLESAAGRPMDLVLLAEAPAPLADRVFRDGRVLVERDRGALVRRKARAIRDYLDFQPVEARCADGVLRAAADRG